MNEVLRLQKLNEKKHIDNEINHGIMLYGSSEGKYADRSGLDISDVISKGAGAKTSIYAGGSENINKFSK